VSQRSTTDRVRELLGREPRGAYEVVVRDDDGDPVVLRNAPLLDDGTPMPTRYWLIGQADVRRIGHLEAAGGVNAAEAAADPDELAAAHARYAAERDTHVPSDHEGPRPSGGVGGTRIGVKCLHAHWAWHLAGGDDPVGRWIAGELERLVAPTADDSPRVAIDNQSTTLRFGDGTQAVIPHGPVNLSEQWLLGDRPRPESLEHPELAGVTTLVVHGPAATALAQLEVGSVDTRDIVELDRDTAEEVFRLVATETPTERAHNPGLPSHHVGTIVATCCIVLAFMRRLDLERITIDTASKA